MKYLRYCFGVGLGYFAVISLAIKLYKFQKENLKRVNQELAKIRLNYKIVIQLLGKKDSFAKIESYLYEYGYRKIAIYGMSDIGKLLFEGLKNRKIEVAYAIDKNGVQVNSDLLIYKPNDFLPDTDLIVVTAIYFFDEIENSLKKSCEYKIISLEEIVNAIQ